MEFRNYRNYTDVDRVRRIRRRANIVCLRGQSTILAAKDIKRCDPLWYDDW